MKTYALKVARVIIETPNSLTICFKQRTLRKIRYFSGQYLTFVINIKRRDMPLIEVFALDVKIDKAIAYSY